MTGSADELNRDKRRLEKLLNTSPSFKQVQENLEDAAGIKAMLEAIWGQSDDEVQPPR